MAVGHRSDDADPEEAPRVRIDQRRTSLGENQPRAGLLFLAADAFDPTLVETVRDAFPAMNLVGATSSAEISSVNGYQEDSITLAAFASDDVEIGTGLGSGLGEDVDPACESAVRQALANTTEHPKVCVVLHESFVV